MTKEKAVQVSSLVKKYGSLTAVDGMSFTVNRAEIFAFLGPNGAGKTTTVEILECLRNLTSGEVRVLGYDVTKSSDQKAIRRRIGVLPQEFNTFDYLTVKENINYFATMFGKRVDSSSLIRLVDLENKRDTYYKHLSGGLKQRVGIAITLVNDPEIVFLDEPTAGLDPKARRGVWEVIRGLRAEGKTIFLTTHYMEEAEALADNVTVIEAGKIVASGTPSELVTKYGGDKSLIIKGVNKAGYSLIRSKFVDVTLDENGDVHVPLRKPTDLTNSIISLTTNHSGFEDIELKKPTLEDVFLNLTGKRIGDEGRVE